MTEIVTTRCTYCCPACGLDTIPVEVPARTIDQDVVHWVEKVLAVALSRDHARRSPQCHPQKLGTVKIPFADTQTIGGPVKR